jgi:hypothetical protein
MLELKSVRSSSGAHGSLLRLGVGNLILENGSDHGTSSGISPLFWAQTHTACTPPSILLTISAETLWPLAQLGRLGFPTGKFREAHDPSSRRRDLARETVS